MRQTRLGSMFVQVNNPFKSGWIGCLHDLILDAFVFHQRRLGAKLKAASSGFFGNAN